MKIIRTFFKELIFALVIAGFITFVCVAPFALALGFIEFAKFLWHQL